MGLKEYHRKSKGPYDGKLKTQVWVVSRKTDIALFSSARLAKLYARSMGGTVTKADVDQKAGRFMMPIDEGGAD